MPRNGLETGRADECRAAVTRFRDLAPAPVAEHDVETCRPVEDRDGAFTIARIKQVAADACGHQEGADRIDDALPVGGADGDGVGMLLKRGG